nr:zinc finger, CCHC-type [Tanacetum cinerariifolium]
NKLKPQAKKKDKSKGKTDKNKKVVPYQPKPKNNPLKRKENPNKDQTCHHCHVAGHWKRNCPLYLEELRKNIDKAEHGAAASGFKEERKLSYGEQYLQVGNEAQAAIEAI